MAKGVVLSPKHGVNPSVMICWFCGESSGVALLGRLKDDAEAPREAVFDKIPCTKCQEYMAKGIMFIEVVDGETDHENPRRTGNLCVITVEAFERLGVEPKSLHDDILKRRMTFLEQKTWAYIGLPIQGTA